MASTQPPRPVDARGVAPDERAVLVPLDALLGGRALDAGEDDLDLDAEAEPAGIRRDHLHPTADSGALHRDA